jgi:hypothetical protein
MGCFWWIPSTLLLPSLFDKEADMSRLWQLSTAEHAAIINAFNDKGSALSKGIHLAGEKYLVTRAEDSEGFIYGRKGVCFPGFFIWRDYPELTFPFFSLARIGEWVYSIQDHTSNLGSGISTSCASGGSGCRCGEPGTASYQPELLEAIFPLQFPLTRSCIVHHSNRIRLEEAFYQSTHSLRCV